MDCHTVYNDKNIFLVIMTCDQETNDYPARHFGRCVSVLMAIEKIERPTLNDVSNKTGLHENTIKGIRARLLEEYGVHIERIGHRKCGYYMIRDWGVLNKAAILNYDKVISE